MFNNHASINELFCYLMICMCLLLFNNSSFAAEGCKKGNCVNGQGTYIFDDGVKYVGEWKHKMQDGRGTQTFPSGAKYVGEFKDGDYEGQGTYTFADGEKYVGEFKRGQFIENSNYSNNRSSSNNGSSIIDAEDARTQRREDNQRLRDQAQERENLMQ